MAELWIFYFCLIVAKTDCTSIDDYGKKHLPSYELCAEEQSKFAFDHQKEDYLTFCKRDDAAEIDT